MRCLGRRCAAVAGVLLIQVNLLLLLFSGAALATAARLKWDPSLYLVVRELVPREYSSLCTALTAAALGLAALAHLAVFAARRRTRLVLLLYAALQAGVVSCEVTLGVWAWSRATTALHSRERQLLADVVAAHDHLLAALQLFARWHPAPAKIQALVKEVEEDLPRSGYVAGAAVAIMVALQASGVLLALTAATHPPRSRARRVTAAGTPQSRRRRMRRLDSDHDASSTRSEVSTVTRDDSRTRLMIQSDKDSAKDKAPLKIVYKNGRMVVV